MTSRRIRIKGIANIPVRRKAETKVECNTKNPVSGSEQTACTVINIEEDDTNISGETEKKNDDNQPTESITNNQPCEHDLAESQSTNLPVKNDQENENQSLEKCDKEKVETQISDQVPDSNKENNVVGQPKILRRCLKKPMVHIPVRKPKCVEPEKIDNTTNSTELQAETSVIEPPKENNESVTEPVHNESNTTTENSVIETESMKIRPLSPSKTVSRTRIRPVPTLIRRSSVQGNTSESEDDGKKSSRIRNDSICSTISQSGETSNKNKMYPDRTKVGIVHKKFQRSEQARKLLEAKKQFQKNFGTDTPDKKRLTMFDLIYYNPVTNPMPPREKRTGINSEPLVKIIQDEQTDDPDELDNEEDNNPVPQVKVGPNGEIILDEQSLVIEQTGTKQGRQQLANSQVIVDDGDRAYGIYKKAPRTREWSARETLRFYKTLNTVGTDFSLMLSLFPGRTRRDLKAKFKREERVNRQLVDKCLTNPLQFDLSELEKQLKIDLNSPDKKNENPASSKRQRTRKRRSALSRDICGEEIQKNTVTIPKQRKDLYSILENSLDSILGSDVEEYVPPKTQKIEHVISRPTRRCRLKQRISYVQLHGGESNQDDSDSREMNEECLEDRVTETPMEKPNSKEENESFEITGQELVLASQLPPEKPDNFSEENPKVPPGSLMILSTEGDQGENVYRVFMVTPNNDKTPINVIQALPNNTDESSEKLLALPPSTTDDCQAD